MAQTLFNLYDSISVKEDTIKHNLTLIPVILDSIPNVDYVINTIATMQVYDDLITESRINNQKDDMQHYMSMYQVYESLLQGFIEGVRALDEDKANAIEELSEYANMSYEEIADAMGCTLE